MTIPSDFHTNRVFKIPLVGLPDRKRGSYSPKEFRPALLCAGAGQGFLLEHGGNAMRQDHRKWNIRGQSLLEYALIAAVMSALAVAMSTYVFRSVQATQQKIQDESAKE